jgi:hypothetical protein
MEGLQLLVARQERFVSPPALCDVNQYNYHEGFK